MAFFRVGGDVEEPHVLLPSGPEVQAVISGSLLAALSLPEDVSVQLRRWNP